MTTQEETFGVYCAGERIDGTDISITYVFVTTPLGHIRMTTEEAEELGINLVGAAGYNRNLDNEDELDELMKRVRALHYEVDGSPDSEGSCIEDGQDYPCATIRALNPEADS